MHIPSLFVVGLRQGSNAGIFGPVQALRPPPADRAKQFSERSRMASRPTPAAHVRAATGHRCLRVVLGMSLLVMIAGTSALASAKPAIAAEADPLQIVGRWQRTDGGYVLELSNPTFDGRLTAAYFNPRPINVSHSGWLLKEGYLLIFVELRDQGYPGSTYRLTYQQDTDSLVGIYFQAAVQQQFEVVFQRMD